MVKCLILSVALVSLCLVNAVLDSYPWGKEDYKKRNEDLLNSIRRNTKLHTPEKSIVDTFLNATNQKLIMRDSSGRAWVAQIAPQDEEIEEELDDDIFNAEALIEKLHGVCAIMPNEYWNYEWCHKREVKQFHLEHKDNSFIKNPDWSLGRYKRTVIVRDLDVIPSPITKIVDHFENGQFCHENQRSRSTEVHIQCCPHHPQPLATGQLDESIYHFLNKHHASHSKLASFYSLSEPDLCSYQAIICSPILCRKQQHSKKNKQQKKIMQQSTSSQSQQGQSSSSSSQSQRQQLQQQLQHLAGITEEQKKAVADLVAMQHHQQQLQHEGQQHEEEDSDSIYRKSIASLALSGCLIRQEDWWTYEVCFVKSIKQIRYHVETHAAPDGTIIHKQVPVNTYVLGMPPLDVFLNETALRERTKLHDKPLPSIVAVDTVASSTNEATSTSAATTATASDTATSTSSQQPPVPPSSPAQSAPPIWANFGMGTPPIFHPAKRGEEKNYLSIEYTDGTPCDLDQVNRSTIVELYCGPRGEILSVREDSTCKYRMKVEVPQVCTLPYFAPEVANITKIVIAPVLLSKDELKKQAEEEAGRGGGSSSSKRKKAASSLTKKQQQDKHHRSSTEEETVFVQADDGSSVSSGNSQHSSHSNSKKIEEAKRQSTMTAATSSTSATATVDTATTTAPIDMGSAASATATTTTETTEFASSLPTPLENNEHQESQTQPFEKNTKDNNREQVPVVAEGKSDHHDDTQSPPHASPVRPVAEEQQHTQQQAHQTPHHFQPSSMLDNDNENINPTGTSKSQPHLPPHEQQHHQRNMDELSSSATAAGSGDHRQQQQDDDQTSTTTSSSSPSTLTKRPNESTEQFEKRKEITRLREEEKTRNQ